MAQSVIPKKEEKVRLIFDEIGQNCTEEEFVQRFKEKFPKDWERVQIRYKEHEQRDVKHKGHPMPNPQQYMTNMYNTWKNKI